MCRSVASDVLALSSGVANGNQTMQHVSSFLSKIPYGGFSPVRLQTGSPRRPSSSITRSYLYAVPVRPLRPCSHCWQFSGSSAIAPPVQRPLARQRVMLSHQVIAYYGLIRVSGLLPPTYAFRLDTQHYGLQTKSHERTRTRSQQHSVICRYPSAFIYSHVTTASQEILQRSVGNGSFPSKLTSPIMRLDIELTGPESESTYCFADSSYA